MKGQFPVAKAGIGLILTLIMIITIAAMLGNIFPKKALDSSKAMDFALEHVYSQTPSSKTFGRVNVDCKKGKYISTADEVSNKFIDDPGKENPVGCKIDNFVLPQKVGWGEKYFPGKGDPEYILYFEDFPEEDSYSWSAMIGGDIILTIVPFGKIAKGFKIFGGAVKPLSKGMGKVTLFLPRGGKKLTAAGKKIPEFGRFSVEKSQKITEVGGRILSNIGYSKLVDKTIAVTKEGSKIKYKFKDKFFKVTGEKAPSKLTKTTGNIKYYSTKSLAYHLERNGIMRYTPRTSKAMVNELYNKGKIGKGLKNKAIDAIENKNKKKVLIQIPSWKDGSATKKAIDSLNKKGFDAEDMNKFIKDMGGTKSLIADDTIYMSSEGAKDLATNLGYTHGEKILALTPKFILINQGEKELDQLIGQGSGEEGDCTLFLQSSGGDRKKFEVESCRNNNKLDLETTKLVKSYGWNIDIPVVGEIEFFDEYTKFYAASPCFSTMTDDTKDDVVTHDKNHNFILYPYKDEDEKIVRVNFPVRNDVPYYTERNANFCYEHPHSKIQLPGDITLWGLAPWPCHELTILKLLLVGVTPIPDDYLNWGTCG